MVSDCEKGRFFQVTSLTPVSANGGSIRIKHAASLSPGNDPTSWGGSSSSPDDWFSPNDSEILKLGAYAYFIANDTNGRPNLMRLTNLDATPQILVEGVENMQILYGVDGNNDGLPEQYLVAPTVANTNVVSVRISLLMSTPKEIPSRDNDPNTYRMLSVNDAVNVRVTPFSDRRIRKVFTTTIKLRNKGLVDG